MPRIGGVNIVAALAGAVGLYFVGFLFYGVIFQEIWAQQTLENHGVVPPGAGAGYTGQALTDALMRIPGALDMAPAMGLGFLNALITAFGVALVLRLVRPASLAAALRVTLVLWIGFAATTLAYNVIYSSESRIIFGIDLAHLLLGYMIAGTLIYTIDKKAIRVS